MYGHSSPAVLAGAGAATLPFTGLNLVMMGVVAFVLITAGLALWRVMPRPHAE